MVGSCYSLHLPVVEIPGVSNGHTEVFIADFPLSGPVWLYRTLLLGQTFQRCCVGEDTNRGVAPPSLGRHGS